MTRTIVSSFLLTLAIAALALGPLGCGGEESPEPASKAQPAAEPAPEPAGSPPRAKALMGGSAPADLPNALVLGLAQFAPRSAGAGGAPKALPATLEFLVRKDGKWEISALDDDESNVFHKAMSYEMPDGEKVLLSAAGTAATLKLWRMPGGAPKSETIWQKDFGGKFSRMRDIEVADMYGDGRNTIVVATHDEGVVAVVKPTDDGFEVEEIDREPRTFVHEIEIGDLDGDGVPEAYATPSEPNRLDGAEQSGIVVRYVPKKGEGRVVVADLGNRHAKEILVEDVDGDGRDELYVIVEGVIDKSTKRLTRPVEIRRYDADTDPASGVVVASIDDRLGRFLTAGDMDGDGKKEMVAALYSSGLWMLRPGDDPKGEWQKENIDTRTGGFEHASILTDLDGDGRDELYVASDNDSEVRRYVMKDGKIEREVIYKRTNGNSVFTWNIMPVPVALAPAP